MCPGGTLGQILAKLGLADTLYQAVTDGRGALKQALTHWSAGLPELRQFVKDYELVLKGLFGSKSPILVDFDLAPTKPRVRHAETTAKAVAQGRQTRVVRGTKGRKARQKITTGGEPGLIFVTPTGKAVPGALAGPTAPATSPLGAAPSNASVSTDASGGGSTPTQGASNSGGSSGK